MFNTLTGFTYRELTARPSGIVIVFGNGRSLVNGWASHKPFILETCRRANVELLRADRFTPIPGVRKTEHRIDKNPRPGNLHVLAKKVRKAKNHE